MPTLNWQRRLIAQAGIARRRGILDDAGNHLLFVWLLYCWPGFAQIVPAQREALNEPVVELTPRCAGCRRGFRDSGTTPVILRGGGPLLVANRKSRYVPT